MKTHIGLAFLALVLVGCLNYRAAEFPLQPGEKVIFTNSMRANEYRAMSGQDAGRAGAVVEITRPARLTCE